MGVGVTDHKYALWNGRMKWLGTPQQRCAVDVLQYGPYCRLDQ